MYSILVSSLVSVLVFTAIYLGFGSLLPAVLPALLIGAGLFLALSQWFARKAQAELQAIGPMLQERKLDEALAVMNDVQARYGRWQFMLDGQIEAQKGMLDYMQMKFDEALPKLEQGTFQNWMAQLFIGLIHHRRGRKDEAWEWLAKAEGTGEKEVIVDLVRATLLTRDGQRPEALKSVANGLEKLPKNKHLVQLQKTLQGKRKINTKNFPELWLTCFPEEVKQQMMVRGMRGGGGAQEQMRQRMMKQAQKGKGRKMRPR